MSKIPENTQYKESTTIPAGNFVVKNNVQRMTPKPEPVVSPMPDSTGEIQPRPAPTETAPKPTYRISGHRESTTIPVPKLDMPSEAPGLPVTAPSQIDRSGIQKIERADRRGNFLDYYSEPINGFVSNRPSGSPTGSMSSGFGLKPTNIENMERDFPIGQRLASRVFSDINGNKLPFQCGELINHLTGSTVGNTLSEKRTRIDNGINWNNVQPGNTVVVDMGDYGHVAAVIDTIKDISGDTIGVKVIEANKDLRGTISYGTYMTNNGRVLGFQNTSFAPKYSSNKNLNGDIGSLFGSNVR